MSDGSNAGEVKAAGEGCASRLGESCSDTLVVTASSSTPNLLYRGLRALVRSAVKVFYGRVEVTGLAHLEHKGATILASNHPNSIVDPLLLGLFEDRQICFCARDGLFRIPGFGAVLRHVGAVPLKRRSDYAGQATDNADAFTACTEVLAKQGVIAIFPEGKTHGNLRIEPIKTGAARMALGAETAHPGLGVRVVPVGITYLVRHAFRSDVHVAFGPPIAVKDQGDVNELTKSIGNSLRELAVHIEHVDDERLLAQVTSFIVDVRSEEGLDGRGQSPAERTALVRRVVEAYKWLGESDPDKMADLRERLEDYMDERESLGLGGERPALQHRGERRFGLSAKQRALFLALGAPFALFGFATCLLPYVALRMVQAPLKLSTDRIALFKILGGAVLFGGAFALQVAAVASLAGPLAAAGFGALLIPAALFARRYFIEARLHRLQLRSLGALRDRDRLAALRAERKAISLELAELRRRYLEHVGAPAASGG